MESTYEPAQAIVQNLLCSTIVDGKMELHFKTEKGPMSSATGGIRVSESLLSASDDSLSSSLALLSEISLADLMLSKAQELFERVDNKVNKGHWSSDTDHFHEKVVAKSREFASLSRGERLLRSIGELQKLMDVDPRDLRTSFDLVEVADDIGSAAVNILRQEKLKDKDAKFTGNDVASMIEFQMVKIFGHLNVRMEELSSTQQQGLVDRVREFVQSLPAEQQRFITDKLGTADLSQSAIRQAIASGAIWAAFAGAVQVFGFAFYTTAAQLLALVSLNMLPFGAYIGLSSTIAVLSSAWMLPSHAVIAMRSVRSLLSPRQTAIRHTRLASTRNELTKARAKNPEPSPIETMPSRN